MRDKIFESDFLKKGVVIIDDMFDYFANKENIIW